MQEKWMIQSKKADFDGIASKYGITPVLARIMRNRDVINDDEIDMYLNGDIDSLYNPYLMKDMEKAVLIILNAIRENKSIRIIGDYDADGICSTFILAKTLSVLNANVTIDIPDRIKDGYGINKSIIDKASEDGVNVIMTCDNGIAAIDEIAYAKELGMTVVVTDHHEVPFDEVDGEKRYRRVCGDVVVNHKQPDCGYPFKDLCGAGIAYKFVVAMHMKIKEMLDLRINGDYGVTQKQFNDLEKKFDEFLMFAAIATVADIVSLKSENRIIVKNGLKIMNDMIKNDTIINLGLSTLIKCANLKVEKINSYHIGFVIAPCLNASGRLETAKLGYKLLCTDNENDALRIAEELLALNDKRKEMTVAGTNKAEEIVQNYCDDKVLVIYLPEVHESVAGIIAGRIREKFNKPTFILTDSEDGVKGSGRSIEEYDMYLEMNKVKHLFTRFGGHTMAAGLSLPKENVDKFRKEINERNNLSADDLTKKVWIDVPVPIGYLNIDFVNELERLEPFGKDNEKPVFAFKNVLIKKVRLIGKNSEYGKLTLDDEGHYIDAVYFNGFLDFIDAVAEKYGEDTAKKMKIGISTGIKASFTYYPKINYYNGVCEVQAMIEGFML